MTNYSGKWLHRPNSLTFEVKDSVASITMNCPEKRNCLSFDMLDELHHALLEADDRVDVNVIILSGTGKDFCAGYDLAGLYAEKGKALDASGEEVSYRSHSATYDDDIWNMQHNVQRLFHLIPKLHKPVIAKVHGNCLAGGAELAFVCDLIIAAQDAKIGHPATRANGTPPNQTWFYHMGPQWTKRLLFTGDRLSGEDAAKIGLVLEAVPADRLDQHVSELARKIAAVDPELLASHKRVVNMAMEQMGSTALQSYSIEADARAHLSTGPRRTQFKKDMAEHGLKVALTNRDAPFGDGFAKVNR